MILQNTNMGFNWNYRKKNMNKCISVLIYRIQVIQQRFWNLRASILNYLNKLSKKNLHKRILKSKRIIIYLEIMEKQKVNRIKDREI